MTDELSSYIWASEFFTHIRIRHNKKKFTLGKWHLNGIEGAWAQLKRRIAHMHSVDYKYLQRVVDEFVWMYNHRHLSIHERFQVLMETACTRRISFKELTKELPVKPIRKSDHLKIIKQAMDTRTILQIEYKNEKKVRSKRLVEPIGLIKYAGAWHLIAWCHNRNAYRDFRVLRMRTVTDTGKPFDYEDHMTIERYMKTSHLNSRVEEYEFPMAA